MPTAVLPTQQQLTKVTHTNYRTLEVGWQLFPSHLLSIITLENARIDTFTPLYTTRRVVLWDTRQKSTGHVSNKHTGMKTKAVCISETSVFTYGSTWRHNPKNKHHFHRRENSRSHTDWWCSGYEAVTSFC